jgi:DNA-binding transcriptional LysR family regulator
VAFRAQVGRALAELDDATAALRTAHSRPSGTLRVTAPYDLGVTVFAPIIAAFVERYPGVTVDMLLTEAVLNFESDRIDVAIRPARAFHDSPSLIAQRLNEFHLALYTAPSYLAKHGNPREPEDLVSHRMAMVKRFARDGALTLWKAGDSTATKITVKARTGIVASDHAFCREAALAGFAIAPLPSMLVGADLAAGRLVRILEPYVLGEAAVYLVSLASQRLQPKIRAFRDFILESCASSPPKRARAAGGRQA